MPMKYLLGVDLGTSSTKSALYSVEGQLIAESTVEVPIYYPTPGVVFTRRLQELSEPVFRKAGSNPSKSRRLPLTARWPELGQWMRISIQLLVSIPGWICAANPKLSTWIKIMVT